MAEHQPMSCKRSNYALLVPLLYIHVLIDEVGAWGKVNFTTIYTCIDGWGPRLTSGGVEKVFLPGCEAGSWRREGVVWTDMSFLVTGG